MPRPMILADQLRELPSGEPLDVDAARTPEQALTPGQVMGGDHVSVSGKTESCPLARPGH